MTTKKQASFEDMQKCYIQMQHVIDQVGLVFFLKEMPESLQQQLFKYGIRKNNPTDYHKEDKPIW